MRLRMTHLPWLSLPAGGGVAGRVMDGGVGGTGALLAGFKLVLVGDAAIRFSYHHDGFSGREGLDRERERERGGRVWLGVIFMAR